MELATETILNCAKRTFKKGSKSNPDKALILKESTKLSVMDSRTNEPGKLLGQLSVFRRSSSQ